MIPLLLLNLEPTVDLSLPVGRVPVVLQTLSAETGVQLGASPSYQEMVVGIQVKGRSLKQIQQALAIALDGRWENQTLVPNADARSRFSEAYRIRSQKFVDDALKHLTGGSLRAPRNTSRPFNFVFAESPGRGELPIPEAVADSLRDREADRPIPVRLEVRPPRLGSTFPVVVTHGMWRESRALAPQTVALPVARALPEISREHAKRAFAIQDDLWLREDPVALQQMLNPAQFEPLYFLSRRHWIRQGEEAVQVFNEPEEPFFNGYELAPSSGLMPFVENSGGIPVIRCGNPHAPISRSAAIPVLKRIDRRGWITLEDALEIQRISGKIRGSWLQRYAEGLSNFEGRPGWGTWSPIMLLSNLTPEEFKHLHRGGVVRVGALTGEELERVLPYGVESFNGGELTMQTKEETWLGMVTDGNGKVTISPVRDKFWRFEENDRSTIQSAKRLWWVNMLQREYTLTPHKGKPVKMLFSEPRTDFSKVISPEEAIAWMARP